MGARKLSYYSSGHQRIPCPPEGGMNQNPGMMSQWGREGGATMETVIYDLQSHNFKGRQNACVYIFLSPGDRTVVCFAFNHRTPLNILKFAYALIMWSDCGSRQAHKGGILYFGNRHSEILFFVRNAHSHPHLSSSTTLLKVTDCTWSPYTETL